VMERYLEAGLAVFPSFELACRVMGNLAGYHRFLKTPG
jgi:hypothetical protein